MDVSLRREDVVREAVDPRFGDLLVKLAEAWGTRLTATRIRLYARGLAGLTWDQLRASCARAVRESRYFPSVAELRQYAEPSDETGLVAWVTLRQAAEDLGAYATVVVADGPAGAALELVFGSWPAFCAAEEGPALAARRQEFLAAYRVSRAAGPRRLAGLCEISGSYARDGRSLAGQVGLDGTVAMLPDGSPLAGRGSLRAAEVTE